MNLKNMNINQLMFYPALVAFSCSFTAKDEEQDFRNHMETLANQATYVLSVSVLMHEAVKLARHALPGFCQSIR